MGEVEKWRGFAQAPKGLIKTGSFSILSCSIAGSMALSGGFSTTTLSSGGRDGEPAEESSAFSLSDIAGVANMVESVVTSSAFSIREALEPTSTVGTSGGCGETSSEQLPASSGAAQESPSTVVTIRGCGGASSDAACVEASIPGFDDQRLR